MKLASRVRRLSLLTIMVAGVVAFSTSDVKVLTRQIQSASKERVAAVVDFLLSSDCDKDSPFLKGLRICGKAKRADLALRLYQKHPTEACRSVAISAMGLCQELELALQLLHEPPSATAAAYNAAIAACGKCRNWEEAMTVYNGMPVALKSTLTANALLSVLARYQRGTEAFTVLQSMPTSPDRVSYHSVVRALTQTPNGLAVILPVLTMLKDADLAPTDDIFDMAIQSCLKHNDVGLLQKVKLLKDPGTPATIPVARVSWEFLPKVGRGKSGYWKMGELVPSLSRGNQDGTITVGVQPHRNLTRFGITFVFYQNEIKLGYLLMENSPQRQESMLMGLLVTNTKRGGGLSKIFLACWLRFCEMGDLRPVTGVIRKPLLALVLQHRFGFQPEAGNGIEVEVSMESKPVGDGSEQGDSSSIVLSATSTTKNIEGAFSSRDIAKQGLRLETRTALASSAASDTTGPVHATAGRRVSVLCRFTPPQSKYWQDQVKVVLSGQTSNERFRFESNVAASDVRRIFLFEGIQTEAPQK